MNEDNICHVNGRIVMLKNLCDKMAWVYYLMKKYIKKYE